MVDLKRSEYGIVSALGSSSLLIKREANLREAKSKPGEPIIPILPIAMVPSPTETHIAVD
jgi:hypothetical protein